MNTVIIDLWKEGSKIMVQVADMDLEIDCADFENFIDEHDYRTGTRAVLDHFGEPDEKEVTLEWPEFYGDDFQMKLFMTEYLVKRQKQSEVKQLHSKVKEAI